MSGDYDTFDASTNTVVVGPTGSAEITVDVVLDVDTAGLSVATMSLEWDTDLKNEINAVEFEELSWSLVNMMGNTTRSFTQLSEGVASSQESCTGDCTNSEGDPAPDRFGALYSFDGASTGNGPASTSLTFARVVFSTNNANVIFDGADIFAGQFGGQDGFCDNAQPNCNTVTPSFVGDITVNPIPEPGTLALLAGGLGTLVLAGRRRARV
ncbi:PEP-CTERM sorting domain-containing protein [Myxococcota bacterium]|nr:PEP-CTERM sorting domain-containing protein [Myxococcota bacterium]